MANDSIADRLKGLLKERDITQGKLAKNIGVRQQTIYAICADKIKRSKYLYDIADFFKINPDWLINGLGSKERSVSTNEPGDVTHLAHSIPLISWEDAAHWPNIKADRKALKKPVFIPVIGDINPGSFALQVAGDSMLSDSEDSIPNGNIVIVDPSISATHDSFVVVKMPDDRVLLRQLSIESGDKYLKILNNRYPEQIVLLPKKAEIIGVLVMTMRSFVNFFKKV